MQTQILNNDQLQILPLVGTFSSRFYLVGGTAIALHIGHRRSIDFDLFTDQAFNNLTIRKTILKTYRIDHTFFQGEGELTILIHKVKVAFFHFPYAVKHGNWFDTHITLPDLLTLSAMKVFALGQRAKWKDYVDLYFILHQFTLSQVIQQTKLLFQKDFNEKLFRAQLGYFNDIDYSEQIDYMTGFQKRDEEIKKYLEEISLS